MLNYIKSECYRVMHSRSTYVMTGIMAVLPGNQTGGIHDDRCYF